MTSAVYERTSHKDDGSEFESSRKLADLGLRPGKPLPGNLPSYRIDVLESIIEGDAEDITEPSPPIAMLMKQAGD